MSRLAGGVLAAGAALFYLPLLVLAVFSFNSAALMAFPLTGFSLAWYERLAHNEVMLGGFVASFLIAQPVALLATACGAAAGLALSARSFRWRLAFIACLAIPFLVPKGVLAIAQVMLMSRIGMERGTLALIVGQVLVILPFTTAILAAVLVRLDPRLEEAARDLGATPWQSFTRIVLPQIRGALGAAYSVGVILSLSDLTMAMFLAGRVQPLSVIVASAFRRELSPELNAMQVVVLALTVLAVAASETLRQRAGRGRAAGAAAAARTALAS